MDKQATPIYEMTLGEWRAQMPWWPNGTVARVAAGYAGHDREIVITFDVYDHENYVNDIVLEALITLLPDHWKIEDRGTRVEVHPTGRLFGGYTDEDIETVRRTLPELGFICEN